MPADRQDSIGDGATDGGIRRGRPAADASLGDERTLGGGEAAGLDTVVDGLEIVDLEARYRVEGTLGQGGMGAVLLATDTRLDRRVAIKRILGEAARSRTAVMRFLTEAKALAALDHANIVRIWDYGQAKDGPFLIMELVDGGSLLDLCKAGPVPLDRAVDLVSQVCDGLAVAHEQGIVHRDIKPANILVNRKGVPKLTDFGLAKAEAADHGMTMTGAVMGTPDFMPPEQRRDAAEVDHRSDLWSLAATFYQVVTGRSPKVIRLNDVPAALQAVLARALEESKEARYQSAREFRDAIRTCVGAAAPTAAVMDAGHCPGCGVHNDASRRFCRGCGESLLAPCLSCSEPMPTWEEICGACGAKQRPLLEQRRREMAARQAETESLLSRHDFEAAERLAVALRDEADPRLRQFVPWATTYLSTIREAWDAQLSAAGSRLAEALRHESSHDYPAAIRTLERVPRILHDRDLDGHAETVGACLERVTEKLVEVQRVESVIRERLAAGNPRDLMRLELHVKKLQQLRPDHPDTEKLRAAVEQSANKAEAKAEARHIEATALSERRKLDQQRAKVSAAIDGEFKRHLAKLREDEDFEASLERTTHADWRTQTHSSHKRDMASLEHAAAQVAEAGGAARKRLAACGMPVVEPPADDSPLPVGGELLGTTESLRARAVEQARAIVDLTHPVKTFATGRTSDDVRAWSIVLCAVLGLANLVHAFFGPPPAGPLFFLFFLYVVVMTPVHLFKCRAATRTRRAALAAAFAATIARFERCKSACHEFLAARYDEQIRRLDEKFAEAMAARKIAFEKRVAECTAARDHKMAELEAKVLAATESLAKKTAAARRTVELRLAAAGTGSGATACPPGADGTAVHPASAADPEAGR